MLPIYLYNCINYIEIKIQDEIFKHGTHGVVLLVSNPVEPGKEECQYSIVQGILNVKSRFPFQQKKEKI